MHRFFLAQSDVVNEQQILICSDDLIHQFVKVLRFERGQKVALLDGSGVEFVVELKELSSKRVIAEVLEKKFCETELPVRIVLAQAILKNMERFEWALQKGTELGISGFVPLITDRTERKVLGKEERLSRILKEAAEQSGRGKVPDLLPTEKFEKVLRRGGLIVVPDPRAEMKFSTFCRNKITEGFSGEVLICVGPEGGFTDREIEMAKKNGAHLVNLGMRILRAETVGMAMTVVVTEALGEI